jgi:Cys-tRNA(Pro) deacylase
MMTTEDLRRLLTDEGVEAEFYEFHGHTMTVEAAADQLETTPEKIVKSVVFVDEAGEPMVAIVRGDMRVDERKLTEASTASAIKIAKAREVERFTGYKIGEVPPVGHGLRTFVDRKVMALEKAYAGGGSIYTLLEISPKDIARLSKAETAEIGH